ncbi:hypothetical protein A8139_05490 [Marinomonas primoryensis]|uniref:Uncharacterized protein n=1 Tax=Marinomonas primoryensis TaxID=178399 RepID=A0A2Z4PR16_9GAMM|nr:hypothetical protein [Marinomonas primoryensis]AWX99503.1 hypothetical protein A8139_05490 [Marinomonas primoryensis]
MTTLYRYNPSSPFLLSGSVEQQRDAITGDLVPIRNTTEKEPLADKEGFVQGFVDGNWEYYVNSVGKEFWSADGTKHTIKEIGEEIPEGTLFEAPIIPPTLKQKTALANAECSKRINTHWNQIGQMNASLGVYGEEGKANCAAWISLNRTALIALLAREDLLEIDVADDQYWPIFEGAN